jgi:hypothetical protein
MVHRLSSAQTLRDRVRVTREAHILKLTVQLQSPATMKAVLEFDLDNRDDDLAHKRCVKALDMALLLFDFINAKKQIEYQLDEKAIDRYKTLDLVYKKFFDLCEEYVINIDSLVE